MEEKLFDLRQAWLGALEEIIAFHGAQNRVAQRIIEHYHFAPQELGLNAKSWEEVR